MLTSSIACWSLKRFARCCRDVAAHGCIGRRKIRLGGINCRFLDLQLGPGTAPCRAGRVCRPSSPDSCRPPARARPARQRGRNHGYVAIHVGVIRRNGRRARRSHRNANDRGADKQNQTDDPRPFAPGGRGRCRMRRSGEIGGRSCVRRVFVAARRRAASVKADLRKTYTILTRIECLNFAPPPFNKRTGREPSF